MKKKLLFATIYLCVDIAWITLMSDRFYNKRIARQQTRSIPTLCRRVRVSPSPTHDVFRVRASVASVPRNDARAVGRVRAGGALRVRRVQLHRFLLRRLKTPFRSGQRMNAN